MRKTVLLLTVCLAATLVVAQSNQDFGTNREGTQKITNGPVVEYTSDHSAMIAWSTKSPAGTYLVYGTDQNNLSQRSQRAWGGTNHRLEIKNLQPNTTYYFQVRSENAQGTGDDVQSPVARFRTVARGAAPDRENRNVGVGGDNTGMSAGSASTTANMNFVPLFRMFGQGDHFYTTSEAEKNSVTRAGVYKDEGTEGYLAASEAPGTTELYRLVMNRGGAVDHFYTSSASERRSALSSGYRDEGVAGYISQSHESGTTPLYRLLGQQGDHFYTTNESERQSAISKGYKDEGVAGYVWKQPTSQ